MLDTVKVQIALTEKQHLKILDSVLAQDKYQWVQYNPSQGDLKFARISGLAEIDQESYHREIRWDVSERWMPSDTWLTVELSLPKLYYGDNIRLLYEPAKALKILAERLNMRFGFKGKSRLPHFDSWRLTRLDVCYCWDLLSQENAQAYLDNLKRLDRFRNKTATKYDTSLVFKGGKSSTYSLKFYLKLPEFIKHDAKEMEKAKRHPDSIKFRKNLASGLLRFEVTLRRKWLQRNEINTIKDVIYPTWQVVFDDELEKNSLPFFNPKAAFAFLFQCLITEAGQDWESIKDQPIEKVIPDGTYVSALAGDYTNGEWTYHHPGGGMTFEIIENRPQKILQQMIDNFIGSNSGMALPDQVRAKLSARYPKGTTAPSLTAFWLYVQKFGSNEAKREYGRDSYYYKKRQLKEAGVSLLEQSGNTLVLGRDFFQNFNLSVPSEYVGNAVDDERDSQNLLNLLPFEPPKAKEDII